MVIIKNFIFTGLFYLMASYQWMQRAEILFKGQIFMNLRMNFSTELYHTMTSDINNNDKNCKQDDPLWVYTLWGVAHELKHHQNKGAFF